MSSAIIFAYDGPLANHPLFILDTTQTVSLVLKMSASATLIFQSIPPPKQGFLYTLN